MIGASREMEALIAIRMAIGRVWKERRRRKTTDESGSRWYRLHFICMRIWKYWRFDRWFIATTKESRSERPINVGLNWISLALLCKYTSGILRVASTLRWEAIHIAQKGSIFKASVQLGSRQKLRLWLMLFSVYACWCLKISQSDKRLIF